MENSWLSNLLGTVGWLLTFAVFGGAITVLLWVLGFCLGCLLRGTTE